MAAERTSEQAVWLEAARTAQERQRTGEHSLVVAVRAALAAGVPILTLANALGVSRSRIRRLAR
jgi:hypothetical protein